MILPSRTKEDLEMVHWGKTGGQEMPRKVAKANENKLEKAGKYLEID
jgi:hypothetical protein